MLPVFTNLVDSSHKGQNNHPGRYVPAEKGLQHYFYSLITYNNYDMPATIILFTAFH